MTNAEGGVITIEGQINHSGTGATKKIHNLGAIVFNGSVKQFSVLISLESTDASVEVKALKSVAGDGGVIILNGLKAPTGKTYNGDAQVKITVQQKFTVSGLQVVAGVVKDDSDSTGKTFDRTLDIAGKVSYDAAEGAAYSVAPVAIELSGKSSPAS